MFSSRGVLGEEGVIIGANLPVSVRILCFFSKSDQAVTFHMSLFMLLHFWSDFSLGKKCCFSLRLKQNNNKKCLLVSSLFFRHNFSQTVKKIKELKRLSWQNLAYTLIIPHTSLRQRHDSNVISPAQLSYTIDVSGV